MLEVSLVENIHLGPFDYDEVTACPFCAGVGLTLSDVDSCPHFVVAFQDGDWHPDLCPPVFCAGFRFCRRKLTAALTRANGIVRKQKPGTSRHPRIEAYFAVDPTLARTLREDHRLRVVEGGTQCPHCGSSSAVFDESTRDPMGNHDIRCAFCGEVADPTGPT